MQDILFEEVDMKFAKDIQLFASERSVSEYTNMPFPYPENGAIEFIERSKSKISSGSLMNFAITINGAFVGIVSLILKSGETNKEKTAELAYWIGRPYWNMGIATKVAGLMIKYGFEKMDLNRITAKCFEKNIGSVKVIEKNGFSFTEKCIENTGRRSGEYILNYELSKGEWLNKKL